MKYSNYNLLIPYEEKIVLFNTLSGNSFLIDQEAGNAINNGNLESISSELKQQLIQKKVIIEDNVREEKIINYFHNKSKYGNSNLTYTILLTWACNLRCIYCYEGAGDGKSYSMDKKTADRVIKHIIKETIARGSRHLSIVLFGGEPLINYDMGEYILEAVSKHCKENNIILLSSIITNGTLLTKEIMDSLIKYGCKYVQITIDGIKDVHDKRRIGKNGEGTFDKIIENLQMIKPYKDKMNIVIRVNVDKTNIKDMPELLDFFRKKGLDELNIDFGIVRGSTDVCASYDENCFVEEELGLLLSGLWKEAGENGFTTKQRPLRKWTYCGLNNDNNFTIEPNGDVYKCWEHTGIEEHKIGDLSDEGYIDNISFAYYEWMTKNPLEIEACSKCVYLPACGGGCGSVSFGDTGEYSKEGCLKIKGVIEEQVLSWFSEALTKSV